MSLVRDVAIVLRRLDFSESSQVLAVLTREHGQQHVIAKGVKRATKQRASVGIDLLEMGDMMFSLRAGREDRLSPLTEWRQLDHFAHLRTDLLRCYAAQYAGEAAAQLTEVHDPHPGLFDGLRTLLCSLATDEPIAAVVRFVWLLLNEIGLRPEPAVCASCQRPVSGDRVVYFSSRVGGAVCRDCEPALVEKVRVAPGCLEAIGSGQFADRRLARAALRLLDYHLTETIGRPLRLSRPLQQAADAVA